MRDEELEREFDAGRGRHAEGYLEALSGTILKRALLLAFLLDRAQAGLPVNTPLLFRRDAPCKSSADVVRAALQASCHGEGDVLRHLALMGYRLYHSQEPIREYDFRVSNLAVDLRDGVRLCRLVDVLGERRETTSAVAAARFPATSRAAKMHNVRVAPTPRRNSASNSRRIGPAATPRTWWTATSPTHSDSCTRCRCTSTRRNSFPRRRWTRRRRRGERGDARGSSRVSARRASTPNRSRPPPTSSSRTRTRAPRRSSPRRWRTTRLGARRRRAGEARTRRDCFDGRAPAPRAPASR